MGHELSGIVEEAAAGSGLAPGDPVYVMPYLSCGPAWPAARARPTAACNIQVLGVHRDGGLTEYLCVPRALRAQGRGITLDQAAMLEFLAIGAHAVRRGGVGAGQRVLVVGAGPIGIAAALFAGCVART